MTSTTMWRSCGASVLGPGHVATGVPNQDAWSSFHHLWGDGIVVSDGLGSKPLSAYGSDAACRAVEQAARRFATSRVEGQYANLLADVLSCWLEGLAPLEPRDAAATCLFAFTLGDGLVRLGLLGDGCVAVVKRDGSATVFMEDKTAGFSNVTSALTSATDDAQWTVLDLSEADCEAIVLCTDGVSDDLEDVEGFVTGLVGTYRGLAKVSAARKAHEMLEAWPVPKHSDDKTIACLLRVEVADE